MAGTTMPDPVIDKPPVSSGDDCPRCGLPRGLWRTDYGFEKDGRTYCCQPCAGGLLCTCRK